MDKTIPDINQKIKNEADVILYRQELFTVLSKYGVPYITGSYALNLMTSGDLDIYVQKENMDEAEFFQLGAEINKRYHPVKMSYRNERITQTKELPFGLYWGVYLGNERKDGWKIDIWAVDEKECQRLLKFCNDIAAKLTPLSEEIILIIKSNCWQDPEYRRSYSSKDIYEAVLDQGITTLQEFRTYLQIKTGTNTK
jgi:hypothetical protein